MSQVGYGPLERVDGPPPIVRTYGLIPAADAPAAGVRIVPDVDDRGIERWINGVQVYPYPPDLASAWSFCNEGSGRDKGYGEGVESPEFAAFAVYLPETCTVYKVWSQDEFKARAVMVLAAVESAAVARELVLGEQEPMNPHLADGNGLFPNDDTPTSIVNALALLEDAIASTGRLGLIHVPPSVLTMGARSYFGFDDKTGVIRTINGTVVIPDAGYANIESGPDGHADPIDGQDWIYASGPVDIRRTEIFTVPDRVEDAVDRGTGGATNGLPNSITYRAERYYVADWDTEFQAAVLVDRCQTEC